MKTLKNLFVLIILILFSSTTTFAQVEYDITNLIIDEKFDSKNKLAGRKIRSYGKQGDEDLKVEIIVDTQNMVKSLVVNEKKIMPIFLKEYKILTDYVISYADADEEEVIPKGNAVVKIVGQGFDEKNQLTKSKKEILLTTIKKELINDDIIKEDYSPFDLTLTGNDLFINAKKQDESIFKKYMLIYKGQSTIQLSKITYFQITQTL